MICSTEGPDKAHEAWRACADSLKIPAAPIARCVDDESHALLTSSFGRSKSKKATGSPTIFVAGRVHAGALTADQLVTAVCDAHAAPKPKGCG